MNPDQIWRAFYYKRKKDIKKERKKERKNERKKERKKEMKNKERKKERIVLHVLWEDFLYGRIIYRNILSLRVLSRQNSRRGVPGVPASLLQNTFNPE